ncbi:MAG TPA: cyclic nucleotide-binding domain-containing protein [Candidatus Acidoferrales bacterium]
MKVVTRGKKPFAASPLLRWCLWLTLAGLGLTLHSMVRPNGLSFTLFSVVGTPLMLLSVAVLLYLFLDDMRKRYSLFSIEEYQAGEVIIAQGDAADRAYFIQRGEVEVVREERGTRQQVARMGPGDYFGEMALLRPNARRTATVAALTQVEVMALGKENFYRLLDAIPALRLEFMGPAAERRRVEKEELREGEESG